MSAGNAELGWIRTLREKLVLWVGFSWGLSAYFPIGVMYLQLLLMLAALAIYPDLKPMLTRLRSRRVLIPVAAFVAWTFFVALVGDWYPDTGVRLFHTFRVALVLCLGLMLSVSQARTAFAGFLAGSVVAALIVAVHHVWGLPAWELWISLLKSRNNFSSGNMITMASASGACFVIALGKSVDRSTRGLILLLGLTLAATVALHAVSRNAQLLLALLLLVALFCRFRSAKAALGGLAAAAVLVALAWHFSPTTQSRFVELEWDLHAATAESNYSTSAGVRLRMYQEALQGMVAHPVLGTGVGSWLPRWQLVWQELGPSQPPESHQQFANINNPHNDFLLAGMETGVPGMLLLAWWLAGFLQLGWRARSTRGGVSVIFGATIVATALVNAPLRDAALGMTLLWLLGVSVSMQGEASDA